MELTDFESDLLRLSIVHNRLETIYLEFPNHMKSGKHELFVRHLFREITIEQLHNFIRIRKDLVKNPKFKKLDNILKVMIEPILEHKESIKKLRNNYVSHIQEEGRKFKTTSNEIILEYDFPTSFSFYAYLAGLVSYYCVIIKNNFKKEYGESGKKYESMTGALMSISSGFKMEDTERKIQENISALHDSLIKNDFCGL